MARRLKTLAKLINDTMPGYRAEVSAEVMNTDRKMGRLRWPGKGRPGNCIRIYQRPETSDGWEREVFSYHTGEWPQTNECVEQWIERTLSHKKA